MLRTRRQIIPSDARAYPLQVMIWHEIANDEVGGVPVSVTFCPLCNTAIAFDRPTNVVDGNVERVMARLFAAETPLPDAKPELKALAGSLVRDERPGIDVKGRAPVGGRQIGVEDLEGEALEHEIAAVDVDGREEGACANSCRVSSVK